MTYFLWSPALQVILIPELSSLLSSALSLSICIARLSLRVKTDTAAALSISPSCSNLQQKYTKVLTTLYIRDHKCNTWIRHQTGVNDTIKKGIHGWAGHVARLNDNRWTKRVTEWTPREWTRRQGRPQTRWRDNLYTGMDN